MSKKFDDMLIDLYLNSDEVDEVSHSLELKAAVARQTEWLALYRRKAMTSKAGAFQSRLKERLHKKKKTIDEIRSMFDILLAGGFGEDKKQLGLGFCRNEIQEKISDGEKEMILEKLGLLDE